MERLGGLYWSKRSHLNFIVATIIATLLPNAHRYGLPALFIFDHDRFTKASELMLTVGTSLLGFIIATVTLLFAITASEKFHLLRQSKSYADLSKASNGSIFWLITMSGVGAILLFIDNAVFEQHSSMLSFIMIFIAIQASAGTAALTWLISKVLFPSRDRPNCATARAYACVECDCRLVKTAPAATSISCSSVHRRSWSSSWPTHLSFHLISKAS